MKPSAIMVCRTMIANLGFPKCCNPSNAEIMLMTPWRSAPVMIPLATMKASMPKCCVEREASARDYDMETTHDHSKGKHGCTGA